MFHVSKELAHATCARLLLAFQWATSAPTIGNKLNAIATRLHCNLHRPSQSVRHKLQSESIYCTVIQSDSIRLPPIHNCQSSYVLAIDQIVCRFLFLNLSFWASGEFLYLDSKIIPAAVASKQLNHSQFNRLLIDFNRTFASITSQ